MRCRPVRSLAMAMAMAMAMACILMSHAAPAAAQTAPPPDTPWNKVAETASVTLYTDPESIEREGMIRRVTEFQDLKQPDPDGVLSRRYKNEYDCQNRMHRIGRVSSFSENRLTGVRRFQVDEWGYWRTIQPNTPFALMYLSLCSDRRR